MNTNISQVQRLARALIIALIVLLWFLVFSSIVTAQWVTFDIKEVTAVKTGSFTYSVVSGDFNGDGYLDLAVANPGAEPGSSTTAQGTIAILPGSYGGFGGVFGETITGLVTVGLVAGDFNGDGKLDLAVSCVENDKITILLGDGTGNFGKRIDLATSTDPLWILAADFNGDQKIDLATMGEAAVSVFLGKGDGLFFPKRDQPASSGEALNNFAAVDLDLDGNLDLVLANASGNLSLLTGDGRGDLQAVVAECLSRAVQNQKGSRSEI